MMSTTGRTTNLTKAIHKVESSGTGWAGICHRNAPYLLADILADTMEGLEGIQSRLKAAGVEMEEGGIMADDGHGMSIFCKDPDGMKVEVRLVKSE